MDMCWGRVTAALLALGFASTPAAPLLAMEAAPAEDIGEPDAPAPEEAKGPNLGRFSFLMQSDFTNAYIFRGIMQERNGFIWQPFFEMSVQLYESEDGPLRGVSAGMGVWNSFQGSRTFAEHSPTRLYETDWYPSVALAFPLGLGLTTTYFVYTSPNGAFSTVQEIDFKLTWDDSEALGRWALNPSANFAVELDGTSFGDTEGTGLGLAVAPTLYELDDERFPLSFSFPVELGLSIEDYYAEPGGPDDTFGYLGWGLTATLPITAVPADYGVWSISVGGKGYYFSETLGRANRGDRLYPTVTGSLIIEY